MIEVHRLGSEAVRTAPTPKLLLRARVIFKTLVDEIERGVKNLTSVHIGKGKHYRQEDQLEAIGRALSAWLANCGIGPHR